MSQDDFEIVSEMFEQVQGIYLDVLAILVRTAYHGEIRQALCTIQQ